MEKSPEGFAGSNMHNASALENGDVKDGLRFAGFPRRMTLGNPLGLPQPLTRKQKFYILVPQMLGAAVIDGLANFGIACAMYRTANKPITVWILSENTLAGDLGVTVFIQGIATFIIASSMVHVDMRLRRIDPFPFPWPDTSFGVMRVAPPDQASTAHGKLWRRFHSKHGFGRGLHFFSGSDVNDVFDFSIGFKPWFWRLFWSAWKGSVLSALFWFLWWPISIAIVAPIWDNNPLDSSSWAPPIIKLIYGFTLGLAMNPLVACIALGSEDAIRVHLREHQREEWAKSNAEAPVMTQAEQARPATSGQIEVRSIKTAEAMLGKTDGSRPSSPAAGGPSPTVATLQHSLDHGSRRASPRNSIDQPRSPVDGKPDALERRPESPLARSGPVRTASQSSTDGLAAPRPSFERRRTPVERPLSVDLAHKNLAKSADPSSAIEPPADEAR